jgi:hypothetical protein
MISNAKSKMSFLINYAHAITNTAHRVRLYSTEQNTPVKFCDYSKTLIPSAAKNLGSESNATEKIFPFSRDENMDFLENILYL